MEEKDIYEVATQFRNLLNVLVERVDALEKRVSENESVLYDDILNPAKEAMDKAELDDFASRNADILDEVRPGVEAIEGEGFDLNKTAFDEYKASGLEEADFMAKFSESIKAQLEDIKSKLGASEVKAEVTVEDGEEPEVTVEADGEQLEADGEQVTEEQPEVTEEEEEPDYEKYVNRTIRS